MMRKRRIGEKIEKIKSILSILWDNTRLITTLPNTLHGIHRFLPISLQTLKRKQFFVKN